MTEEQVFTPATDKTIKRMAWVLPLLTLIVLIAMAAGADRNTLKDNEAIIIIHEARLDQIERQFERHIGKLDNIDEKLEKIIYALREHRTLSHEEAEHEAGRGE